VNTSWNPPYGERSIIPDRFNEEILTIQHTGNGSLTVKLELRAYDEGIALRYRLDGPGPLTVASEKTSFPLPATSQVWVSSSAQGAISKVAISAMGNGMERPLTAELAPDLFAAFGEADLRDHARMKFNRSGSSTLVPVLSSTATYPGAFSTPWRYVRVANTATGLLDANHLPLNLSTPSTIANTSWIRPGKVLREVTLTTTGGMACVNWAAENGVDFIHFDAGWYGNEYDNASDATTVTVDPARSPGPLDLPAVIAHAKSKGLGVLLYVNRRALETQLDQILPLYQQWGVDGIKFGFVNVGSQQWTKWLHDSIAACAQHQLMVNVHDEYRMTGVERTLPNFMTAEGIRGDEESPPNEMVLRTIFTRGLAGAGDQTNCYFAARVPTMGSHASQLAKSVLIYSPWQYLFWYDRPADAPGVGGAGSTASVLQGVPEMSFFKRLPTVWDETRWLGGHPESHAVVARRKGDTWFLAALNGTAARDLTVPLDFLSAGQGYRIELFYDDPAVVTVTDVQVETGVIDRNHVIERSVGARKGLTAILTPTDDPIAALVKTVDVAEPPPPPPPPPVGMITFETAQGYPTPPGQVAGINGDAAGASFSGIDGWTPSTSTSAAGIHATGSSGEYQAGQAIGAAVTGTYIGAKTGVKVATGVNTIQFDAPYATGTSVGLYRDLDGDGRYDGNPETGMQFAIGGNPVRFNYRNAGFGTENFGSGFAGTSGHWYRFLITIGNRSGGSRPITMAVRNLTTGAEFDFDASTPGSQPWSFQVTDAQFGASPELTDGVMIRTTSNARIDNLRVTAATLPGGPAYNAWIGRIPDLPPAQRQLAADPENDRIPNLLEFVLDGDPTKADPGILPQTQSSGEDCVMTFKRRDDSEADIELVLLISESLHQDAEWIETVIGPVSGSSGDVSWTVDERGDEADLMTLTLRKQGRHTLFARLKAVAVL
jgi:alpha-glucosidase